MDILYFMPPSIRDEEKICIKKTYFLKEIGIEVPAAAADPSEAVAADGILFLNSILWLGSLDQVMVLNTI